MVLYTVQSPLFSRSIVERALQATILTGSSLNVKGGGRFGNPEAYSLDKFESNYKMAASEIKVSALSRRVLRKKGTVNSLSVINVMIDCN